MEPILTSGQSIRLSSVERTRSKSPAISLTFHETFRRQRRLGERSCSAVRGIKEMVNNLFSSGASMWASISGGTVTTAADCKAYGSSYQAFFKNSGTRYITTKSLDLRYAT